jgi:hypothetical protein
VKVSWESEVKSNYSTKSNQRVGRGVVASSVVKLMFFGKYVRRACYRQESLERYLFSSENSKLKKLSKQKSVEAFSCEERDISMR